MNRAWITWGLWIWLRVADAIVFLGFFCIHMSAGIDVGLRPPECARSGRPPENETDDDKHEKVGRFRAYCTSLSDMTLLRKHIGYECLFGIRYFICHKRTKFSVLCLDCVMETRNEGTRMWRHWKDKLLYII